MAYAQLHTQALRNHKVLGLSDAAFRLWIAGLVYCQEHLTDGEIREVALVVIGATATPEIVAELTESRLWHHRKSSYFVHDWSDWNATRAQIESRKQHKAERNKRWRSKQLDPKDAPKDATEDASRDASQDASARRSKDAAHTHSHSHTQVPPIVPRESETDVDEAATALWEVWCDAARRHGGNLALDATWKERVVLEELVRAYPMADLEYAADAHWAKSGKHNVWFLRGEIADLLAARQSVDYDPNEDWRPNWYHNWKCDICGEYHYTDKREEYRKVCLKRHDTVTFAEYQRRMAEKAKTA